MDENITESPVGSPDTEGKVIPIDVEYEMKRAFIEYSMSVIVDRALPDVRDGHEACTQEDYLFVI